MGLSNTTCIRISHLRFLMALFLFVSTLTSLCAADKKTESRLQEIERSIESSSYSISIAEKRQDVLDSQLHSLESLIDSTHTAISNEIAASDRLMSRAAIILTIIAVLLGVYITWLFNRVQSLSETIKSMSDEVDAKKTQVEKLVNDVNNQFDSFFQKIRRADTVEYLKRLEKVPMDITNLTDLLLARELEPEDFDLLKNAYRILYEQTDNHPQPKYSFKYQLLFFQHFFGNCIEDDYLREGIVQNFLILINCCFDNDIKKSLSDLAIVLKKPDLPFDRVDVLRKLLDALDQSKYKDDEPVYSILQNGINDAALWEKVRQEPEVPKEDEAANPDGNAE